MLLTFSTTKHIIGMRNYDDNPRRVWVPSEHSSSSFLVCVFSGLFHHVALLMREVSLLLCLHRNGEDKSSTQCCLQSSS